MRYSYNAAAQTVTFTLNAKAVPGQWVALGISDNKQMANTDVIHVGIRPDGTTVSSDR